MTDKCIRFTTPVCYSDCIFHVLYYATHRTKLQTAQLEQEKLAAFQALQTLTQHHVLRGTDNWQIIADAHAHYVNNLTLETFLMESTAPAFALIAYATVLKVNVRVFDDYKFYYDIVTVPSDDPSCKWISVFTFGDNDVRKHLYFVEETRPLEDNTKHLRQVVELQHSCYMTGLHIQSVIPCRRSSKPVLLSQECKIRDNDWMTHILPLEIGMDAQAEEAPESTRIYMRNKNMTLLTTTELPGDNLHSLFYYAAHHEHYPDESQLKDFKKECFDALVTLDLNLRLASFSKHPLIVPELRKFDYTSLAEFEALRDSPYVTTLDIIGCAEACRANVRVYDDNVCYDIHITHSWHNAHIYHNDPAHAWVTLFLKRNGTKQAFLLPESAHLKDNTALIGGGWCAFSHLATVGQIQIHQASHIPLLIMWHLAVVIFTL